MKVADLEGAQLDAWIARAEGHKGTLVGPRFLVHERCDGFRMGDPGGGWHFAPSTNWTHGGPIIERELIEPHTRNDAGRGLHWGACPTKDCETDWHSMQRGSTILIAAMRVYVESKFGDEVPDTDGA